METQLQAVLSRLSGRIERKFAGGVGATRDLGPALALLDHLREAVHHHDFMAQIGLGFTKHQFQGLLIGIAGTQDKLQRLSRRPGLSRKKQRMPVMGIAAPIPAPQ